VPGTEVQLPTLNVEHADGSSGQSSRRPSKLTIDAADETSEPLIANVAELAAAALQQLEPEVNDAQLAEVLSHQPSRNCLFLPTSGYVALRRTARQRNASGVNEA